MSAESASLLAAIDGLAEALPAGAIEPLTAAIAYKASPMATAIRRSRPAHLERQDGRSLPGPRDGKTGLESRAALVWYVLKRGWLRSS
jgi:hypothetical protein